MSDPRVPSVTSLTSRNSLGSRVPGPGFEPHLTAPAFSPRESQGRGSLGGAQSRMRLKRLSSHLCNASSQPSLQRRAPPSAQDCSPDAAPSSRRPADGVPGSWESEGVRHSARIPLFTTPWTVAHQAPLTWESQVRTPQALGGLSTC